MHSFSALLGKSVVFACSVVYIACYASIRLIVELINYPFEKISDQAERVMEGFLNNRQ